MSGLNIYILQMLTLYGQNKIGNIFEVIIVEVFNKT